MIPIKLYLFNFQGFDGNLSYLPPRAPIRTFAGNDGYYSPPNDEEPQSSSGNSIKMKLKEFHKRYYMLINIFLS